jgi:CHAT domain-containing protein
VVLAGNPEYGTGAQFSPLPQSASEISAIESIARANGHEATVLVGAKAVEPAIRGALPARIIHIATHGVFRAAGFRPTIFAAGPWLVLDPTLRNTPGGRPAAQPDVIGGFDLKAYEKRMAEIVEEARRTGRQPTNDQLMAAVNQAKGSASARELAPVTQGVLALTGANTVADPFAANSPAFLTDVDLATLDLTATDLVVLSACDLGQSDQSAFQGLASMQTAVVVAGARSLVSSLWKVPDAEAKAFMQRFYENLLVRGLSRADALREAQQSASVDANGRPRSPYLWAGWTLFGEGW